VVGGKMKNKKISIVNFPNIEKICGAGPDKNKIKNE